MHKNLPGQAGPFTIAFKPIRAVENKFSTLFSSSIDRDRFSKLPFVWSELGTAKYDFVILHWPTEFFRPESRKEILKQLVRMFLDKQRRGTRFIWVVHNLEPHDGAGTPSELTSRLFLWLVDGFIFLSEHSKEELWRRYPIAKRARSLVIPHGLYTDYASPPRDYSPSAGMQRLLFFGLIREYKNVERLISEARRVNGSPFSLTVLGACLDKDLETRIKNITGDDPRIRLDLRTKPVPDEELELEIDTHDAVVLPYRIILNSGVAMHALSRYKPILAPAVGSLPELQHIVGNDWVHLFEDDITADRLNLFLGDISKIKGKSPDLSTFEWERIGSDLSEFLINMQREG